MLRLRYGTRHNGHTGVRTTAHRVLHPLPSIMHMTLWSATASYQLLPAAQSHVSDVPGLPVTASLHALARLVCLVIAQCFLRRSPSRCVGSRTSTCPLLLLPLGLGWVGLGTCQSGERQDMHCCSAPASPWRSTHLVAVGRWGKAFTKEPSRPCAGVIATVTGHTQARQSLNAECGMHAAALQKRLTSAEVGHSAVVLY
jgi:hypothetical protein